MFNLNINKLAQSPEFTGRGARTVLQRFSTHPFNLSAFINDHAHWKVQVNAAYMKAREDHETLERLERDAGLVLVRFHSEVRTASFFGTS